MVQINILIPHVRLDQVKYKSLSFYNVKQLMEILNIEETPDTPKIVFDKKNGIFEISGRSLPEDSAEFFMPVLEWISNYKAEPNVTTNFVVKLEYANTATSKFLLDILLELKDVKGTKIMWYYLKGDEDMEEVGHEFSEQVDVPFEFKEL